VITGGNRVAIPSSSSVAITARVLIIIPTKDLDCTTRKKSTTDSQCIRICNNKSHCWSDINYNDYGNVNCNHSCPMPTAYLIAIFARISSASTIMTEILIEITVVVGIAITASMQIEKSNIYSLYYRLFRPFFLQYST
jgi:hypothetical protein